MCPKSKAKADAGFRDRRALTEAQQAAWERFRAIVKEGWSPNVGKLDREALHDRDALRHEFLLNRNKSASDG